jgi:hypothetical protein
MNTRKSFLHGLMGSPVRFEVLAWLQAAPWAFYSQTDIQRGTSLLQGDIRAALIQLEQLGLLARLEAVSRRPKWRTVKSPIFDVVAHFVAALEELESGRADPRLVTPDQAEQDAPLQLP